VREGGRREEGGGGEIDELHCIHVISQREREGGGNETWGRRVERTRGGAQMGRF